MLGRASIVLSSIATVRVMTMLLSPEQVGKYSVLTTFSLWFSLTLVSPAGNFINRQFTQWLHLGTLWKEFHRYALLLIGIAAFASLVAFLAIQTRLLDLSTPPVAVALYVAGILVFLTVNSMLIGSLNLLGKRGLYAAYTGATAWLGLTLSAGLTLVFGRQAEPWIVGQIAGWAVVSVLAYYSLRHGVERATPDKSTESAKNEKGQTSIGLWAFAWPLVISTSLYWFQVQGYRLELQHFIGTTTIGLVTTGLLLGATPIATIDTLLGELLRPQYYRGIASGDRASQEAAWTEMATTFLTWLIPITLVVGASGVFLAAVLVGPAFQTVSGLVVWGVAAEFVRAIYSLYMLAAHARFQTKATLGSALLGATVVLLTIVPAAHWNVYMGTGLSLLLGMVVTTVLFTISLRASFTATLHPGVLFKATSWSGPIVLTLIVLQALIPHPSLPQAAGILAGASFATLIVQSLLNRKGYRGHRAVKARFA